MVQVHYHLMDRATVALMEVMEGHASSQLRTQNLREQVQGLSQKKRSLLHMICGLMNILGVHGLIRQLDQISSTQAAKHPNLDNPTTPPLKHTPP